MTADTTDTLFEQNDGLERITSTTEIIKIKDYVERSESKNAAQIKLCFFTEKVAESTYHAEDGTIGSTTYTFRAINQALVAKNGTTTHQKFDELDFFIRFNKSKNHTIDTTKKVGYLVIDTKLTKFVKDGKAIEFYPFAIKYVPEPTATKMAEKLFEQTPKPFEKHEVEEIGEVINEDEF
jgi:hypothetical protein